MHINYAESPSSEITVTHKILDFLIYINHTLKSKKLKKSDNFEVDILTDLLTGFKNKLIEL